MKKTSSIILLLVIIALAIFLRFWQLGEVPISPDWDETALGYNAYSILKTGRDEFGAFLPLVFRSFDDYKPPLYIYLTIPSIWIFGLNVFSVRLPSAVFGVLAVIGTYFLVRELFRKNRLGTINNKQENSLLFTDYCPLLSSLLLAISPWHIQFSRVAFEANIGVTLNIWGVYFFLKGLEKSNYLIISTILFGFSLYAYHSERIFAPLLFLLLLFIFRKVLFKRQYTRAITLAASAGLLIVLPLIPVFFNQNSLRRLTGTSAFRQKTELLSRTIRKLEFDKAKGYLLGEILDNRRLEYAKIVTRGYLIHFSPRWLFLTGDHERHHAPDMGLLYLWELPFILLGLYWLVTHGGKIGLVVVGWMLLAPIAASPTTQLPHAIRTLVFLPTFQIVTAIGLLGSYSVIKKRRSQWLTAVSQLTLGLITVSFLYYVHMYFVHTNPEYSQYWQYGYKQIVAYAEAHKKEYKKIVVSTDLEQPYMFFLFYTKYDPQKYLAGGGTISGQFDQQYNHFDVYEFRKIDWMQETKDGSILYIGTPDEIKHGTKVNLNYLDGNPAMAITDRE